MPQAVYIHIPFCNRICPYCDFTKYVLKGQPVMQYLEALKKEMEVTVHTNPPKIIKTIFVGGGTPTTLNKEQMIFLLQSIQQYFQAQPELLEYTMEANPECINEEKLRVMKEGGINRLSFGVQTFEPSLLKKIGRMHTPEQVFEAIHLAKKAGFENISIDLMFGLPHQTIAMFEKTLEIAFSLGIQHFSAYSLKIEEGTFFHSLYEKDKLLLPNEEEESVMYEILMDQMSRHGYNQYEISNFALPGYESKHNLTYWRNNEYYGLGAGAHGYVQGVRHVNAASLDEYLLKVKEQGFAFVERHSVSQKEAMEDMMIMGLRTKHGVSKELFVEQYGVQIEKIYGTELKELVEKGLLETDESRFYLSQRGIFLGNEVFAHFLKD